MTGIRRRRSAQASALGGATLFMPYIAGAQAKTIKINILSDMSCTYSEATGQGDVIAASSLSKILISATPNLRGGRLGRHAAEAGCRCVGL